MNTRIFNKKPKFFVSYPPGAGGQFLCLLIISLQEPVVLIDGFSGHPHLAHISAGRDTSFQFSQGFLTHTSKDMDLEVGANWLVENFKFYNIDRNYYTIHGLLKNTDVITKAWAEAKIVHISVDGTDLDQMWYNWILKSMTFHNDWYRLKPKVQRIQKQYNKLHWVNHDNMDSYRHDFKLCTYIAKFGSLPFDLPLQHNNLDRCYWLKFQDIFNKNLINQLDQLIDFLCIKVSDERKAATIQLINEYVDSQKIIPWNILLEDYQ